ncbi:probable N-acetyltransferase HLS1-like [Telopea speciosissima]|uniref:probable N-acetyltransferase HLS1-like n=1 Tax=Telopea speciosissima TaxID=54955 RepID=UPI001CC41F4D|nr:probable N-acetyltransferase HLS1-like [Telopea speciosissima]
MGTHIENKVLIREFNEDRDIEAVEKLEKSCEVGYRKGISISTNLMGDPLCRIRLYPTHVMLIAELVGNGELVGVIRGCMKHVGTSPGKTHMNIGCILGLRVSPKHRRIGIGLKLVESMEDWAIKNGAEYICLAIEANNVASTNLFVLKCNYIMLSSLVILVQPISSRVGHPPQEVRIEKLSSEQAISLYKSILEGKGLYPLDIDVILKENLNLGTWVSFFGEEEWIGLHGKEKNEDFILRTPSSWAMVSIWNTCATYKLQIRRSYPCMCFHTTLSHAKAKVFPCLKIPTCDLLDKPFGFFFLYGLHGEGQRIGELMKSLWCFACNLAGNVKDCKAIITELEVSDPLRGYVPQGTSMSSIDDIWYLKRVRGSNSDEDDRWTTLPKGEHLFVDPRDF